MNRWGVDLAKSIGINKNQQSGHEMLADFFEPRGFVPQTPEQQKQLDDFSLVSSALALVLHVALDTTTVGKPEENEIINDMVFELEQRHTEYQTLSQQFGEGERQIIKQLYQQMLQSFNNGEVDLLETIDIINTIYASNPYKKYHILRLCLAVAWADGNITPKEMGKLQNIARHLHIEDEQFNRLVKEVKTQGAYDIKYKG